MFSFEKKIKTLYTDCSLVDTCALSMLFSFLPSRYKLLDMEVAESTGVNTTGRSSCLAQE